MSNTGIGGKVAWKMLTTFTCNNSLTNLHFATDCIIRADRKHCWCSFQQQTIVGWWCSCGNCDYSHKCGVNNQAWSIINTHHLHQKQHSLSNCVESPAQTASLSAYHIQTLQQLVNGDLDCHSTFSQQFLQHHQTPTNWLPSVLWGGKAHFMLSD